MPSPTELIRRMPWKGLTTQEMESEKEQLALRIEALSAVKPEEAKRYLSTAWAKTPLEGVIRNAAKYAAWPDHAERPDHLFLAFTWLKLSTEMLRHLETPEAIAAAQAHTEAKAADLASRPASTPDPLAWCDDAAEYYGGGSVD